MLSFRRISVFPLLLFCVLATLLVTKVLTSLRPIHLTPAFTQTNVLAAQNSDSTFTLNGKLTAQAAPTTAGATATPVYSSCRDPLSSPPPATEKLEFCQQSSFDLTEYLAPTCAGGKCATVNGSAIMTTGANVGNVNNYVENVRGGFIKQHSNEIYFLYKVENGWFKIYQDTIWGGGPGGFFQCQGGVGTGQAFNRSFNADKSWGRNVIEVQSSCGKESENNGFITTYAKQWDGKNINDESTGTSFDMPESSLAACTVPGQTGIVTGGKTKLIFQGAAKCNNWSGDMVSFTNVSGVGAGETYMYCKGLGLCGFYEKIDFTQQANQPKNWSGKDVCNLKAGGSTSTIGNYFEYNLQRECGQTPIKVLNNFMDEYSVSCMPQAKYVLELANQKDCDKTSKGCVNWNSTGDLKFTAGSGQLFGLFRNEAEINKRYNNANNWRMKNRQESVEAYLTARPDTIPAVVQSANFQYNGSARPDLGTLSSYQSPLYKLSTLEQQCTLTYHKLAAVKELCAPFNRIEGEENTECAINQFLPNTSLRYLDLLERMKSADNCEPMMHPDASNSDAIKLREQILSIDPAMEVGYRPAFVVVATLVGDPDQKNPKFQAQGSDTTKFWQIDYMEVKVPSFGSDFLDKETATSISNPDRPGGTYQDPLKFTANLLTTPQMQEKFRTEEEADRNKVRDAAKAMMPTATGPLPGGTVIGASQTPIKCRSSKGVYSVDACDNIARALVTFINASTVLPAQGQGDSGQSLHREVSPARGWLPANQCAVDEKDLYGNALHTEKPVAAKYQVAEEGKTIGSKLESKIQVGKYVKKTDAAAEVSANIRMVAGDSVADPQANNFGSTHVFFISPHNYTLMYAQNAFLSMLTTDQQKWVLDNKDFNSVLKTTGVDSYSGSKDVSTYCVAKGTQTPIACPSASDTVTQYDRIDVSAEMKRAQEHDKELTSPIMWQTAGNVANFPTRLFTLLTNPPDNPTYQMTIGCTGPNATELWLQGKCKPVTTPVPGSTPIPSPAPTGQCIDVWVSQAQAQAAAAQMKKDLPGQQFSTNQFAGWSAYFSAAANPTSQHIFYNDCDSGKSCINYVLDRVTTETEINPYLIMAMAFNESGGLISKEPGFVGPHFGCGIDRSRPGYISNDTIENKLECAMGFFARNRSLTSEEALRLYGYSNANRNNNLNTIIKYLSNGTYTGTCDVSGSGEGTSTTK